ncbi:hypothetical protein PtB15_15B125 [Puccinia triticina]|nr:hypothetical protein PtB15_15B125 [Puccinia triticina]
MRYGCEIVRTDSKTDGNARNSHEARGGSGGDSTGKGKAKAVNKSPAGSERGEGWAELKKDLQHPSIAHSNIPVLVIANKQDREARPLPRQKSAAYDPPLQSSTSTSEVNLEDQHHQQLNPMIVEEIKSMFNPLVMESEISEKARSLSLSEANVLGASSSTGVATKASKVNRAKHNT